MRNKKRQQDASEGRKEIADDATVYPSCCDAADSKTYRSSERGRITPQKEAKIQEVSA